MELLTAIIKLLQSLLDRFGKKEPELEADKTSEQIDEETKPEGMTKLPKFRPWDLTMYIDLSKIRRKKK